jgi:hypothetical protein
MSNNSYSYFANMDKVFVCHHEAGHTTAGLICSMVVTSVEIFREKKGVKRFGGLTKFDYICSRDIEDIGVPDIEWELKINEIAINYAGLAAEKIFFEKVSGSKKFPGIWKEGSHLDTKFACDLMTKYNLANAGKERLILKKNIINNVNKLLLKHWSDVTLIAQTLFNKNILMYSDLQKLLISKSENKDFWREQLKGTNKLFDLFDNDKLSPEDFKKLIKK